MQASLAQISTNSCKIDPTNCLRNKTFHNPPPGPQSHLDRWSLVFFTRPGNSVVLRALVQESPLMAEGVRYAVLQGRTSNRGRRHKNGLHDGSSIKG
ncbi:hypothetical protein IW262DRAFT_1420644 [Armillaria fumosa]|nr:hypothetical protein IW262DRAFT_1420644 [Armillaria fumosa]